jgi:hypothetical protein
VVATFIDGTAATYGVIFAGGGRRVARPRKACDPHQARVSSRGTTDASK